MRKLLTTLALASTLLFPKEASAEITEPPFYIGTTIQENESFLKETEQKQNPYLSFLKTISIPFRQKKDENILSMVPDEIKNYITLYNLKIEEQKQVLTLSILPSGKIDLLNKLNLEYNAKLELFFNSPSLDYYFNDGNRLYISGGFSGRGYTNLEKLLKNPSEINSLSFQENDFFANAYIIVGSPFSKQCLILNAGIDNLSKNLKQSDINLSGTFELPEKEKIFSPRLYGTLKIKIPLNDEKPTISARTGIKMRKENSFLMLYGQLNYNDDWKNLLSSSLGIKIEN